MAKQQSKTSSPEAPLQIEFKLLTPDAKVPTKAYDIDAGFDLYTSREVRINGNAVSVVPTGVAFNVPAGYFGKIYERSGISTRTLFSIKTGVLDAGYTGEVGLVVHNHDDYPHDIAAGTKLAQIVFHKLPEVTLNQVQEFTQTTERGANGFGSSGN